jgi:hypothetical protein
MINCMEFFGEIDQYESDKTVSFEHPRCIIDKI